MGQKTNPNGFRLISTQTHLSQWYSSKVGYHKFLQEDALIRSKATHFFKGLLVLSKVEIHRVVQENETQSYTQLLFHVSFPKQKEMSQKLLNYFPDKKVETSVLLKSSKLNLKRITTFLLKTKIRQFIRSLQFETQQKYSVRMNFIKNTFEDATLIAKFIGDQLERRIPFRRILKQTIRKVQRTKMRGVKIEVSGRLNGIEIARSERKREGQVPLHTLIANIDYSQQTAQTIYGLIGIKVWLCKGFQTPSNLNPVQKETLI